MRSVRVAASLTLLLCLASIAGAQQAAALADAVLPGTANGIELPFAIEGPPPPELPVTAARDDQGRITLRAVRLTAPLTLDGLLDEPIYRTLVPVSDFLQVQPFPGAPATEKTEVWISFDEDNVYVSVRASETQPDRMILNELRRDSPQTFQNEGFGVAFDTFYDRRNWVEANITPLGGRADGQGTNESQFNPDFNMVWEFEVRRNPSGWTGEMAIPFKSLRYRPGGGPQVWSVQLRRISRWKNEMSYLTRLPDGLGLPGMSRMSRAATLVGIEVPPASLALDVKPYVTSDLTTDLTVAPGVRNEPGASGGLDVKYGVTPNLTADFTYNTDFGQVEADEQQVNLTRFSLFFPEKRDFFLENQGLFNFSGITGSTAGDTPLLFYSRRIGLDRGTQVPIDAGGRLTGRAGRFTIGLLNIQTGDVDRFAIPSANFTVARIRRDVLRRSTVGAMFTRRSMTIDRLGSAETYGLDGTFAFFANLTINTYWARTRTPGATTDDASYRAHLNYNGDRYGAEFLHLAVGDNFNPEVGFVRRDDMRRSFGLLRFSPRPQGSTRVRKYSYEGSLLYIENGRGVLEDREARAEYRIEFFNSDVLQLSYANGYELLPTAFRIARGVTVPAGGYSHDTWRGQFTIGQQRPASGTVFVEHGAFYEGDRTAFGYSAARVKFSPRLAVEPGISVNRVDMPFGSFTTRLFSSRVTYTFSTYLFVSGLLQYNSSNNSFSTNARLRWEYSPGSEFFIVYNEGRDTGGAGFAGLQNRALVVKVNRLFRF